MTHRNFSVAIQCGYAVRLAGRPAAVLQGPIRSQFCEITCAFRLCFGGLFFIQLVERLVDYVKIAIQVIDQDIVIVLRLLQAIKCRIFQGSCPSLRSFHVLVANWPQV